MSTTVNATITGAELRVEDRGFLDLCLTVEYGTGMSQCFGGHCLHLSKSFKHWKLESIAGHYIMRCLEVAGTDDFKKLMGRTIRVRSTDELNSRIEAIGHITKNDWFCPFDDFKELK